MYLNASKIICKIGLLLIKKGYQGKLVKQHNYFPLWWAQIRHNRYGLYTEYISQ